MAQKDNLESFIRQLFQQNEGRPRAKQDILSKAADADFAADVLIFFKQLPDRSFDESSLIDGLNDVIRQRGRADAVGGFLRHLTKTPL